MVLLFIPDPYLPWLTLIRIKLFADEIENIMLKNDLDFILIFSTIRIQLKWVIIYLEAGIPNDPGYTLPNVGPWCSVFWRYQFSWYLLKLRYMSNPGPCH